jgi:EAL domain-containing protein (putative c-di-GMP-specific phosphodiesterase class I)
MRAIVKTVIALGKSLEIAITAEGSRPRSRRKLREFGCPQVQGFLYGYPGPPDTSLMELKGNVAPISAGRHSAA